MFLDSTFSIKLFTLGISTISPYSNGDISTLIALLLSNNGCVRIMVVPCAFRVFIKFPHMKSEP